MLLTKEGIKMKMEYIAPAVEIIVIEAAVNTLNPVSGDKEGSAVLLSWLVD